jgi:uncharacterized protein YecT (DUF1311 family)
MRRWGVALVGLALTATPAASESACRPDDLSCLESTVSALDAELADRAVEAMAAIDDWDGNLQPEDRVAWKKRLAAERAAFGRFAALRCAEEPPAGTGPLACRHRLGTVALADLGARYDLGFGAYRASLEQPAASAPAADLDAGEEYGPCAGAPPGDCDYCGVNACFEALEIRLSLAVADAFEEALERLAARPARESSLRAEQAAWSEWVDIACENGGWETPNRWAHSIYATSIGICRVAEAEARVVRLHEVSRGRP